MRRIGLLRWGMTDLNEEPSLKDLSERLAKAKGEGSTAEKPGKVSTAMPTSGLGMAFRVGTELVAGVAVGAAIGYGLDQWLGTTPWLLILFFFLGAGGGMMNVFRAATGQGMQVGYQKPDPRENGADTGDTKREG